MTEWVEPNQNIENHTATSELGLRRMREVVSKHVPENSPFIIGVHGSYARREVTSGSDVDLFFLTPSAEGMKIATEKLETIMEALSEAGFKMPAKSGVFETPLPMSEICTTGGGQDDSNLMITRRMLMLLESDWLFGESGWRDVREEVLKTYTRYPRSPEQICMFLLNDIIRYWRTICVDFEHKVQVHKKPRAIRLIKLRFSRMLLYFGGVLAVAETQGLGHEDKVEKLKALLTLPTVKRVQFVLGPLADPAIKLYSEFLNALDDKAIRSELNKEGDEGLKTEAYISLRSKAHEFRMALINALTQKYHAAHPIRSALLL